MSRRLLLLSLPGRDLKNATVKMGPTRVDAVVSGVIEAGCKTVIGSRLKQSGMSWTLRGANSIIAPPLLPL